MTNDKSHWIEILMHYRERGKRHNQSASIPVFGLQGTLLKMRVLKEFWKKPSERVPSGTFIQEPKTVLLELGLALVSTFGSTSV